MSAVLYLLLSVLLVGVDQLSKWWAATALRSAGGISLLPGVFELQYCENDGVAFSLLEGQRWLFIPMTVLIVVVMLAVLFRSPLRQRWLFSLPCALILAGGVGNLIDRILYGYVIDFLYFSLIDFPIFNFADCCVVVGAIVLFAFLLFGLKGEEDTPLRTLFFGVPVKQKEKDSHG